jgi:hypothetical protein
MHRRQAQEGGTHAGVDYIFEIPLKVAQTIVGFKHDEDGPHLADGHFVVLDSVRPQHAKGWLGTLFT